MVEISRFGDIENLMIEPNITSIHGIGFTESIWKPLPLPLRLLHVELRYHVVSILIGHGCSMSLWVCNLPIVRVRLLWLISQNRHFCVVFVWMCSWQTKQVMTAFSFEQRRWSATFAGPRPSSPPCHVRPSLSCEFTLCFSLKILSGLELLHESLFQG